MLSITTLSAALAIIVCIGIPAAAAVYFLHRRDGTFLTFVTGILCFYISQPILRIPLLNLAFNQSTWLSLLPYTSPVLYYLLTALTAGLFEELARFIGLKYARRGHTTWIHGIAYGIGHGGCEAAWIFCLQVLPLIRQGQSSANLLIGTWERFFCILLQTGLSLVVLQAIQTNRKRYLTLAILLHTLVDFLIIIGNLWIVEGLIAIEGLIALYYILKRRHSA